MTRLRASDYYDGFGLELFPLTDCEHVRKRPVMYLGDTGVRGLHNLVSELIDNALDQFLAGRATQVCVTLHRDGSCTVADDGVGIAVGIDDELTAQEGREMDSLEATLTRLKYRRLDYEVAYKTYTGLHGMGLKVVNFLSAWCRAESRRHGALWRQEYAQGIPQGPVTRIGDTQYSGTTIRFKPDPEIFSEHVLSFERLVGRLAELAYLHPGFLIVLTDERIDATEVFLSRNGVAEFVEQLTSGARRLHPEPLRMQGIVEGIQVDVALLFSNEEGRLHSYLNDCYTYQGGYHEIGLKSAVSRTLLAYGRRNGCFGARIPSGYEVRAGLTAVLTVLHPEPRFVSSTTTRSGNAELRRIVSQVVAKPLARFLEENPAAARSILASALDFAAREVTPPPCRQVYPVPSNPLCAFEACRGWIGSFHSPVS